MRVPKVLVVDATDDLCRQVQGATSVLRPRPQVVHCQGFQDLDKVLGDDGPFEVLIAGPSASSGEGLQDLRRRRMQMPRTTVILAFERWASGSLRDTVRTGALDILRLPVADQEIVEAIEQALEVPWPAVPEEVAPPAAREGAVIAVVSATGGCGKTFFATNLGYHLHTRFGKRTCILDLDLQFGELSTALRLRPKLTVADLVGQDDAEGDLGRRFDDAILRHDTGIYVLAAPEEPADADLIPAADVVRIIETARSRFDVVIIDTPAWLSEAVLAALEHAGQIFAMATLDLPSVRNLGVLLATMNRLKVPHDRVQLLLNKVEPDVGIDVPQVAKYFPQGFSMVIPYGREVNRALNMGMPILAYAARSEVSRALVGGLACLMPVDEAPTAPGARDPDRRRRLGRRKKPA